jgi:hypothetical protein
MTSEHLKVLVARSADDNGEVVEVTALLEIAYQLAVMNERNAARDELCKTFALTSMSEPNDAPPVQP